MQNDSPNLSPSSSRVVSERVAPRTRLPVPALSFAWKGGERQRGRDPPKRHSRASTSSATTQQPDIAATETTDGGGRVGITSVNLARAVAVARRDHAFRASRRHYRRRDYMIPSSHVCPSNVFCVPIAVCILRHSLSNHPELKNAKCKLLLVSSRRLHRERLASSSLGRLCHPVIRGAGFSV